MKKQLLLFCFLIVELCGMAQSTNSIIVYKDSITGTCIVLPKDANIEEFNKSAFHKFTAILPNSMLSFYSMKNDKDEPFSWETINKFDKDNRLGKYIDTEKIARQDVEGWHRFYENKSKSGKTYEACVTVIRGKDYAVYLFETAWARDKMVSKQVLAQSTFEIQIWWKRMAKENYMLLMTILGITAVLPFILFPIRKRIDGILLHVLCIGFSIIGGCALALAITSLWTVLIWIPIGLLLWYVILTADSWTDVWNLFVQFYNNL